MDGDKNSGVNEDLHLPFLPRAAPGHEQGITLRLLHEAPTEPGETAKPETGRRGGIEAVQGNRHPEREPDYQNSPGYAAVGMTLTRDAHCDGNSKADKPLTFSLCGRSAPT